MKEGFSRSDISTPQNESESYCVQAQYYCSKDIHHDSLGTRLLIIGSGLVWKCSYIAHNWEHFQFT